jgi:acetyl-CoA C-acetyltransferase
MATDIVIVAAARTAVGKFGGTLAKTPAVELGAAVLRELLVRSKLNGDQIGEVILGQVLTAGAGQNPARQAVIKAGLPTAVPAMTINKVCGSGLKAVMLAAQAVRLGDAGVVVAGGMESMSNTPYALPRVREGLRMGNGQIQDLMIQDGLWCAFEQCHMGLSGEVVAEEYAVTREAQDAWAAESHRRAAAATAAGWFRDEIVPVSLPQKKGDPIVVDTDEPIRADTTAEALGRLKPAFKTDGTVTAGNAPGVNDGAAALVVTTAERARKLGATPVARIVAYATSGLAPRYVMMTPVPAVQKVLAQTGWSVGDVDLFELNEAFAAQAVAVTRELGIDASKVNVQGGAVALGHAIGSSGARVLTTLLYALQRTGGRRGIATLCLGGGNGVALAVEQWTD